MLSYREIEDILSSVIYNDYTFVLTNPPHTENFMVSIEGRFPERNYWLNQTYRDEARVRQPVYIHASYTREALIEALFRGCLDLEYHEAAESFYVDKIRVKDPHVKAADNA